jgi:hypothetical protein
VDAIYRRQPRSDTHAMNLGCRDTESGMMVHDDDCHHRRALLVEIVENQHEEDERLIELVTIAPASLTRIPISYSFQTRS